MLQNKVSQAAATLAAGLAVDLATGQTLVQNGFFTVASLLEAEPQDIADILGIDLEQATAIHARASQEQVAR